MLHIRKVADDCSQSQDKRDQLYRADRPIEIGYFALDDDMFGRAHARRLVVAEQEVVGGVGDEVIDCRSQRLQEHWGETRQYIPLSPVSFALYRISPIFFR